MVGTRADNEGFVSVIIATLNAEKYLSNALESIAKQSYTNYEILIVDGGSTDNTLTIARSFSKVKIMSQQGKGLFDAWNEGIRSASGNYIAFLDSDDHWEPDTLTIHMNALSADPDLLGSVGHARFFLEANAQPPAEFKMSLLNGTHLGYMPGCFAGRKSIFDKIGFFETHWQVASDMLWFAKLKELQQGVVLIDKVVLNKRVHNKNISYSAAKSDTYDKELLQLLHMKLRGGRS